MTSALRIVPRLAAAAVALCMVIAAAAGEALAQWQPTKPIEFVVMAGKGGGADKATRFIVDLIAKQKLTTQPITVVNLPGQSGGEALAHMKKKTGDDHTLMFTLNSFYTTPLDQPQLGVDIATFAPIARLGEDVFLLWVHSDEKDIKTIDDFAKAAKAKGKDWVMAGTGTGSEDQLLTEFLNATYGLKITYKPMGGGGEVAKELAEKRVQSTVNNPAEQNDFYPKGMTKPIVAITPARLQQYGGVPTLRETGMDFHYFMQRSVVGAPGMTAPARAFYDQLFKRLFESAEWQDYRAKNSLSGDLLAGQPLMSYWLAEREKHVRWKMAIDLLR